MKEFWLNLPVKDVKKSIDFFREIGFSLNENCPPTETMASLKLGEKGLIVMLFENGLFSHFANSAICDSQMGAEVMISFDAESRKQVDKVADKIIEAGGTIFSAPSEIQGWMYGFGFADPDGHRWNMIYMDNSSENAGCDLVVKET